MMLRFLETMFTPKQQQPKFYTGRHRAPGRFRLDVGRARVGRTPELV